MARTVEERRAYMQAYRDRPGVKARAIETGHQWREANREKVRETKRAWRAVRGLDEREAFNEARRRRRIDDPEYNRKSHLKTRYGLTAAQWGEMFARHGFACAICGKDDPGSRGWHTDHCHKTGKVRGILCSRCNLTLGMADDNPSTLDLMAQYVRHHAR